VFLLKQSSPFLLEFLTNIMYARRISPTHITFHMVLTQLIHLQIFHLDNINSGIQEISVVSDVPSYSKQCYKFS